MDKIPNKVIPTIPVEEWEKIVSESDSANKILNSPDFEFLRKYLKNVKDSSILLVATNAIKDVMETQTSANGYSKSIKTTKEEQLNEIAGCIKFIDKLFTDLESFSKQKDEYLKKADEKAVIIQIDKEK
jgi:hypothetical protein